MVLPESFTIQWHLDLGFNWSTEAWWHIYVSVNMVNIGSLTHLTLAKMAANIFRCIFVNEKFCILIEILLKFVPNDIINNNTVLV